MEEKQWGVESHRPTRLLLTLAEAGWGRKLEAKKKPGKGRGSRSPGKAASLQEAEKLCNPEATTYTRLGRGGPGSGNVEAVRQVACWPGFRPRNNWNLISQYPRGKGGTRLDSGLVITAWVKADVSLLEREVWALRRRHKPTPRQTNSSSEMTNIWGSSCRQSGN